MSELTAISPHSLTTAFEYILEENRALYAYVWHVQRCLSSYGSLLQSDREHAYYYKTVFPPLLVIKHTHKDKSGGIYVYHPMSDTQIHINDEEKPFCYIEVDMTDEMWATANKNLKQRYSFSTRDVWIYLSTKELLGFDFGQLLTGKELGIPIRYHVEHYSDIAKQSTHTFRIALSKARLAKNKQGTIDTTAKYCQYAKEMRKLCEDLKGLLLAIPNENVSGLKPQDIALLVRVLEIHYSPTRSAIAQCEFERAISDGRFGQNFLKNW